MSAIRSLEKQFEPKTVQRIRAVIQKTDRLRAIAPGGATKYYCSEVSMTLEAGALLAALTLVSMTLELYLRATAALGLPSFTYATTFNQSFSAQEFMEQNEKLGINRLVDDLVEADLFRIEDAEKVRNFQERIRNPLAHGLVDRLIYGPPEQSTSLFGVIDPNAVTTLAMLEDFVEGEAIEHIDAIVSIMLRNTGG